jgi:tripeptidyl-peptidase-1
MKRQCAEWMKLALQGTTIVMSSGDSGVGGTRCAGASGKIFEPDFASTCPYVLSVGSTEWDKFNTTSGKDEQNSGKDEQNSGKGKGGPSTAGKKLNEVATLRFPSGGGFSNVFPRPSYQKNAVSHYLEHVDLGFEGYNAVVINGTFTNVTTGLFNLNGRAVGIPWPTV